MKRRYLFGGLAAFIAIAVGSFAALLPPTIPTERIKASVTQSVIDVDAA